MSDNMIKQITTDDLRHMEGQEGLVLQGCGGDPQEWVAHGCPTMSPTGWAASSKRNRSPRSPGWGWWARTAISTLSLAGPPCF